MGSDNYQRDYGDTDIGKIVLIDYPLHLARESNECCLGLYIGMQGKGKTRAATRHAEKLTERRAEILQIEDRFDIDCFCVTYREFITKLREMKDRWEAGEDIAGKVIIFDEFQKSASARKFMSMINQAINDVLQTFRYLNLIVIFTTPHLSFIDINSRALMHFQVTMKEKNIAMGLSRGELNFTEIKNDPQNPSDKLYHFAPRIFTENGTLCVRNVWFEQPTLRMQRLVDDKVSAFKGSVIDESDDKLTNLEQQQTTKQKTKGQVLRDFANEVYVNRARYYDDRRDKWDKGRVMLDYPNLTPSKWNDIKPILTAMIQFGIKLEDIDIKEEV